VAEQDRYCLFELALFVNIMDIECVKSFDIDVSCKQLLRVFSPVITVSPAVDETLQVGGGASVGPSCIVHLVGEGDKGKLLLEKG